MRKQILLALIAAQFGLSDAHSASIVINFDTDASGNPINAPSQFSDTTRLSELYAPLGVHFSGPGGNDGGAILNVASNFGVNPRSGSNFFAFNRGPGMMMGGGIPRDPETITFDALMSDVSIFASGGNVGDIFLMQAFNAHGVLVDTDTVASQTFAQLQVASPLGIKSIVLSVTVPNPTEAFVFDDLSANMVPVPEPSATLLMLIAVASGTSTRAAYLRRRRMA